MYADLGAPVRVPSEVVSIVLVSMAKAPSLIVETVFRVSVYTSVVPAYALMVSVYEVMYVDAAIKVPDFSRELADHHWSQEWKHSSTLAFLEMLLPVDAAAKLALNLAVGLLVSSEVELRMPIPDAT